MSGELDRSFFGTGGVTAGFDINAVAVQPNNFTVFVGVEPGTSYLRVSRVTTSGVNDGSFGKSGTARFTNIPANKIDSVTVLADGKILLGGTLHVKLNANGTLDTTYGGGDGVANSLLAADRHAHQGTYVYPDGSMLELGTGSPTGANYVFKYKADGTVDKTFGSGGGFNIGSLGDQYTSGITVDASGRIYVAFKNNDYALAVTRLTAAGKLDTTWGNKGVAVGTEGVISGINGIAALTDGRVLVSWNFSTASDYYAFDVFSANGTLTSANVGGDAFGGGTRFQVESIKQAKDGSIYIGGTYSAVTGDVHEEPDIANQLYTNSAVVHLNKDLTLDTKYSSNKDGIGGFGVADQYTFYQDMAIANNGSAVIVGRTYDGQAAFARLTGNGVANRISYTVSPTSVVINGSDQADYITVQDVYDDRDSAYDRVVYLDTPLGNIRSADVLTFNALSASQKFTFNLKGGDDRLNATDAFLPVTVNAGAGNDYYTGSHGADSVHGDDGDDTLYGNLFATGAVIYGDIGNDTVMVGVKGVGYGGDGNDNVTGYHNATLYGNAGNDLLGHATSKGYPGLLDGGDGDDTAAYIAGDILKSIEHANLAS
ncbi:MAG: hypothetical protein QM754_04960 [Tepidisphaeraceae bacterium]